MFIKTEVTQKKEKTAAVAVKLQQSGRFEL